MSELIQLSFDKIMQTRSYTVIVLKALEKRFAIYTDSGVGRVLQLYLTNAVTPRPLTHDFISKVFESMEIKIKQVVINDVEDTVYFARLFLEQPMGDILHIIESDGRPSDFLILALMWNAPIYCTKEVLDKTIAVED
ncbi:MAG: DUF151 domain-containing protein [Parachlamydiaceae bacterium]|nr:DUF151 domain-containing protein [Parachlamydiaceae bacterium]